MNGKIVKTVLIIMIVFTLPSLIIAEDTRFVRGKLISIDQESKTIVVRDNNGVDTTIIFEDEETFSRIERFRIKTGDKVSVRYIFKGNKKIGKYIRSLRGC